MAKTLLEILQAFAVDLQNNYFQIANHTRVPTTNSVALSAADMAANLTTFIDADSSAASLINAPYALIVQSIGTSDTSELLLSFESTDNHPMAQFLGESDRLAVSVPLGYFIKRPVTVRGQTRSIYQDLVIYDKDKTDPLDLDQPLPDILKVVDRCYYQKNEKFYNSLCVLDDLQADFQPEENQRFAKNMMDLCVSVAQPRMWNTASILDADQRILFIEAWKRNRPAEPVAQ
jgi:hypothetical protein